MSHLFADMEPQYLILTANLVCTVCLNALYSCYAYIRALLEDNLHLLFTAAVINEKNHSMRSDSILQLSEYHIYSCILYEIK